METSSVDSPESHLCVAGGDHGPTTQGRKVHVCCLPIGRRPKHVKFILLHRINQTMNGLSYCTHCYKSESCCESYVETLSRRLEIFSSQCLQVVCASQLPLTACLGSWAGVLSSCHSEHV